MTAVAGPPPDRPTKRQPNPRGTGDRLRAELLSAALAMVEAQGARQLSLRGIARRVGIAATSVYLHFPDVDHLLAAVVAQGFDQLTAATTMAARGIADPAEELRVRCRTYCHFALDHPRLYQLMFQADLPLPLREEPAETPGRRSLDNLVAAVRRCLEAGCAPAHDDTFRLATLIWAAEHGLVLARIARPIFPWAPIDTLVDEMVTRMMGFDRSGTRESDHPS
jgi:AcrR family transcriptional regulator